MNVADLRKQYTKAGLLEAGLPGEPMPLFRQWFREALESEVTEPNAMALATVKPDGKPSVRIVLMKGIEEDSISFYTNYGSSKASELEKTPHAACTFWWAELERQVRISGPVKKVSEDESTKYFDSRPRESQIGAWASSQSRPVNTRIELEELFSRFERKFDGKKVPRPDHWGGYAIHVNEIEFWQGRPGRMHDRILYRLEKGEWNRQRLAP
ncbi:pyridoxamine 5'-phosphate oxidase [Rhodohalobacter mucosus]|uniref:pyridoxamine 5'-phosphate oxidase n=1 Tax=Rhodohalobacter mucosus TaxID=2079485 RepID=UPI0018EE65C1|nr:pyridoxamine 5'-phosphate oxidase [Rhodohalobacter mucosus]